MTDQNPSDPTPLDPAEQGWTAVPVPPPVLLPPGAAPPPPPGYPSGGGAVRSTVVIDNVGEVPLASMVERIGGAVIDLVLLLIPTVLVAILLPGMVEFAAGAVVSAAYTVTLIGGSGATLGGRMVGIKCVAAGDGALPGYTRSGRRWMALYLPGLVPGVGWLVTLLVGLSPLVDPTGRMQGLHDKWAGTYVVKTGGGSPIQQEDRLWLAPRPNR